MLPLKELSLREEGHEKFRQRQEKRQKIFPASFVNSKLKYQIQEDSLYQPCNSSRVSTFRNERMSNPQQQKPSKLKSMIIGPLNHPNAVQKSRKNKNFSNFFLECKTIRSPLDTRKSTAEKGSSTRMKSPEYFTQDRLFSQAQMRRNRIRDSVPQSTTIVDLRVGSAPAGQEQSLLRESTKFVRPDESPGSDALTGQMTWQSSCKVDMAANLVASEGSTIVIA